MSYKCKTISVSGTECEFIKSFIASLTSEDSRIICEQSTAEIEDMFDTTTGDGTNKKPVFSFLICGTIQAVFTRQSTLATGSSNYIVQFKCNTAVSSQLYISIIESSIQKTLKYQIVSNSKVLFIRFGNPNSIFPLTTDNQLLVCCDSANSVVFFRMYTDVSYNNSQISYYVGSDCIKGTKINRLPYLKNGEDFTQIEVIKDIIITNASNEQLANPDGIWDSTFNNAVDFPLTINNEQCCYLDNYTVMKC